MEPRQALQIFKDDFATCAEAVLARFHAAGFTDASEIGVVEAGSAEMICQTSGQGRVWPDIRASRKTSS